MFALLRDVRPVLLKIGEPGTLDHAHLNRVRLVDAMYDGRWELPVVGEVAAPTAVLIRPDGHDAWAGEPATTLSRALTNWFGAETCQAR